MRSAHTADGNSAITRYFLNGEASMYSAARRYVVAGSGRWPRAPSSTVVAGDVFEDNELCAA